MNQLSQVDDINMLQFSYIGFCIYEKIVIYCQKNQMGMEYMAKLCLGTVQFGMDYGINNRNGQPEKEKVFDMLDIALDYGIQKIDTAFAYGNAEDLLGEYFTHNKGAKDIEIITKLQPNILDFESGTPQTIVRNALCRSLTRMRVEAVDGYMLHTPGYIYNEDILDGLERVKKEGLTQHIGISIYDMKEGIEAIGAGIIDYIQLPYNVLDQRGMYEGFLEMAKEHGVQIYCRSVFLQGLIMMNSNDLPEHMEHCREYLHVFEDILKRYDVDKVSALIHFVLDNPFVDYLVFGVDTKEQLLEDLKYSQASNIPNELYEEVKERLGEVEKAVIFPSLWKK